MFLRMEMKIVTRLVVVVVVVLATASLIVANENDDDDDKIFKRTQKRTYLGFDSKDNQTLDPDFTFIQAADPQFGLIEVIKTRKSDGGWEEELRLTENAVKEWNELKPKPKFVVICGDLANKFPQLDNQVAMERRRKQLNDLKGVLRKLDSTIPLILLSGNHDILDVPTADTIQNYTNEFGDDYFSFWYGKSMFIALNLQLYRNHENVNDLYEEQNRWLDQQLAQAKTGNYSHVIVFQHIPWFLKTIDEPVDDYFNIPNKERKMWIDKLYEANVRFIFAGHFHLNSIGKYENLTMVTTSAIGAQLGNDKSGYRVVRVTPTAIEQEYHNIALKNGSVSGNKSNQIWLFFCFVVLNLLVFK